MWLDKNRRNDLHKVITEAGSDPADFELARLRDMLDSWQIRHLPTVSTFRISPGIGSKVRFTMHQLVGDRDSQAFSAPVWDGVLPKFSDWIRAVESDAATPDLWADSRQTRALLVATTAPSDSGNAPFTEAERSEVMARLDEIKQQLLQAGDLSEQQVERLDETVNFMSEAAGRLGRLDWRSAALGAVFSLGLDSVFAPQTLHQMLVMLFRPLAHLFGHPALDLPYGP